MTNIRITITDDLAAKILRADGTDDGDGIDPWTEVIPIIAQAIRLEPDCPQNCSGCSLCA